MADAVAEGLLERSGKAAKAEGETEQPMAAWEKELLIAYLFYYILCKLATKNFPLSEKNSLYNRENYGIILSAVA